MFTIREDSMNYVVLPPEYPYNKMRYVVLFILDTESYLCWIGFLCFQYILFNVHKKMRRPTRLFHCLTFKTILIKKVRASEGPSYPN